MSYTFSDLQTEVKSRATLSESSTNFDTQVKNAINTSLFRTARETNWKNLRRKYYFNTEASYDTGTGAVTLVNNSANVTVTGATFITDGIKIGRYVSLDSSTIPYKIIAITGETTFTVDRVFDGTGTATGSYNIYGQGDYVPIITSGKIAFLWHEAYGYPYIMSYVDDFNFYNSGVTQFNEDTPVVWKQWGTTSVIEQPYAASVMTVSSSSSSDTNIPITVYGTVSGYPDSETITTDSSNGTTTVNGSKSFDADSITRVTKGSQSIGRITVTSNSANVTVSVIPVGDTIGQTEYLKISIFPFPDSVIPINVTYYEDPVRLVNDNDMHILGHEFDEAIICRAVAILNYSQSKKQGDYFIKLWADEIRSLKIRNMDNVLSWFPRMYPVGMSMNTNPHPFLNYSQLGGAYGPVWR